MLWDCEETSGPHELLPMMPKFRMCEGGRTAAMQSEQERKNKEAAKTESRRILRGTHQVQENSDMATKR